MLEIRQFIFNNFEENTYLAIDRDTGEAAVIDPGMMTDIEREQLDSFITRHNLRLTQIVLTHAHLDHCFGVDYVRNQYGVPVKAHSLEAPLGANAHHQGERFGMSNFIKNPVIFDVNLKDGDEIMIGKSRLNVIHVPGHSPGGIVLYDAADGVAFVGDSIFQHSIGRTDLTGGDYNTLVSSLRQNILTLPDDTVLLPGHGPSTSVAIEKRRNPFLR